MPTRPHRCRERSSVQRIGANADIQVGASVQRTGFLYDREIGRRAHSACGGKIFSVCDVFACLGRQRAFVLGRAFSRLSLESGLVAVERKDEKVLWDGSEGRLSVGMERYMLHRQDDQHGVEPIARDDVQVV